MTLQVFEKKTEHWSIRTWISFLQRGGGPKKRFQCCLNSNSPKLFLYLRAIQGHSGGALVDPRLQDNVLLPNDFIEHIDHVGNSHDLHSIIQSALILGGNSLRKDTHAVFFTAVNPVRANQHKEVDFDRTKPRIAVYKNTWKIHQNTVYQKRSNAIVLYITLPAICIEKSGKHEVRRRIVP